MRACVVACVVLVACPSALPAAELIPISTFARIPALARPALSPDGKKVVAIAGVKDLRVAVVLDLTTGKAQPVLSSMLNKFDLTWCDWANDTRILCGLRGYDFDIGNPYAVTRLVAVNADASAQKVLLQNERPSAGNSRLPTSKPSVARSQFQDEILDWSPDDPDTVLITADQNGNVLREVYSLNVYTGALREVTPEREPITAFFADGRGEVRLGRGYDRDNNITWIARRADEREWRTIARYRAFGDAYFSPVGFGDAPNSIYVSAPHEGREALWLVDLEDKKDPELAFAHREADVASPLYSSDGHVIGVSYETDKPYAFYTDPKAKANGTAIRAALPSQNPSITDQSRDGKVALVATYSDVQSTAYYMFDVGAGKLRKLGSRYPELDKAQLAPMRAISYPARDGTKIPGYLTAPVGAEAKNLPLIVLPHGGPIARDSWGFDFLVQFLASRGYAVLQMNFRGSSGYGGAWFAAAHRDWGGLTYDDIVDGARWAMESGLADPKRSCIVGWSFGGYAALLGAVRNPDLFRCSASIAGISDLKQLLAEERMFTSYRAAREQVGTDTDKLERDSPRRHVAEVRIPILMVHGHRDTQVNPDHSRIMAAELKKAGKPHEYVFLENATHQIDDAASRTVLLEKLEQFLAQNLAAQSPAAGTTNTPE